MSRGRGQQRFLNAQLGFLTEPKHQGQRVSGWHPWSVASLARPKSGRQPGGLHLANIAQSRKRFVLSSSSSGAYSSGPDRVGLASEAALHGLVSRRPTPELRLLSLIFGARSEIIRRNLVDTRYLRAYGKSKHSQDTDRADTRTEAIFPKGTFGRSSAFAQGQDRAIDQALFRIGSSLAECIASGGGRPETTLFPPELRVFLTCLRNAVSAENAGNEAHGCRGNVVHTARELSVSRNTVYRELRRSGLR